MSKIEKILKYINSIPNYTDKLVNRKLRISYQYTFEENLCMYLTLSHNSLDYYGEVIIYDSNRDCDIFNYTFTCSKEEEVLNVLDELTHFGTTIGETTRRLYREIDHASSLLVGKVEIKYLIVPIDILIGLVIYYLCK